MEQIFCSNKSYTLFFSWKFLLKSVPKYFFSVVIRTAGRVGGVCAHPAVQSWTSTGQASKDSVMKRHEGNMLVFLQCVCAHTADVPQRRHWWRLSTSTGVRGVVFLSSSKQDVLSSLRLLWGGQPARRYSQTLPLCQVPGSLSLTHLHTHTKTQW